MSKKLILSLMFCLFNYPLCGQSFFEKYNKQINRTFILIAAGYMLYLLKLNKSLKNENFNLKRQLWKIENLNI